MCSDTTQAKILCTCKNHMLSVSGFRCWQLQVPLRGHRDGSGWAWEPVTLQCTPFWSCPAAIPLFLAGTGYKVLFPCCTASLKKLLAGSNFQLDNDNEAFMECFQRLEALHKVFCFLFCVMTNKAKKIGRLQDNKCCRPIYKKEHLLLCCRNCQDGHL